MAMLQLWKSIRHKFFASLPERMIIGYDIEEGLKGHLADTWSRFVLWGKWKIQQE
jgi:hypothetical protein